MSPPAFALVLLLACAPLLAAPQGCVIPTCEQDLLKTFPRSPVTERVWDRENWVKVAYDLPVTMAGSLLGQINNAYWAYGSYNPNKACISSFQVLNVHAHYTQVSFNNNNEELSVPTPTHLQSARDAATAAITTNTSDRNITTQYDSEPNDIFYVDNNQHCIAPITSITFSVNELGKERDVVWELAAITSGDVPGLWDYQFTLSYNLNQAATSPHLRFPFLTPYSVVGIKSFVMNGVTYHVNQREVLAPYVEKTFAQNSKTCMVWRQHAFYVHVTDAFHIEVDVQELRF